MIDIVINEKKPESRAEELHEKYKQPIKDYDLEQQKIRVFRDMSITLGMILDEMRGVKGGK